jgi:hypothetical protein
VLAPRILGSRTEALLFPNGQCPPDDPGGDRSRPPHRSHRNTFIARVTLDTREVRPGRATLQAR